jgi:hypothetical protein
VYNKRSIIAIKRGFRSYVGMKPTSKLNFGKAVILSKVITDKTLAVVDSDSTIHFLNIETLKTLKSVEFGIKHKRYKESVVAISSDAKHFASISESAKESNLYETSKKNLAATVDRHHGEVSCVGIDPKNRYMFSCGDDGKTYVIEIESSKLVFILPPHKDVVYDIVFSDDARWLATASHDKSISLFYLPNKIPKHFMYSHTEPVKKLCFLDEHRLFSVDKTNVAIIWDYYEASVITRLEGIHEDITCVTKSADNKFLFLGTELGYILVYELENYSLLASSYIKLSAPITSLTFYAKKDQLIVATQKGEILLYSIFNGQNNMKVLYKKRDFETIEKYIEANPLLVYTKVYQAISLVWEQTLKEAKEHLQNRDKDSALKLLKPYMNVGSKKRDINNLFEDFEKYAKLNKLVDEGKIALAYSLAHSDPLYLDSKAYEELESRWNKVLAFAQKHVTDLKGEDKITEVFAPYRGVSEKTQDIQEVLTHHKVYKKFVDSISKKDYKLSSSLADKYDFLKGTPEHEKLVYYLDELYIESQKLIKEGKFNEAIKVLEMLEDFSDFEDIAKEAIADIKKENP